MVTFSIIIPTYNSEKTLFNTLKTVLNQTFTNFEIIIIDGCSADNTLQIAEFYKDERIAIISEKDQGIYDAMNKGISLASGKWLYFLGSDDEIFDQNVLTDVYNQAINNQNHKFLYGNVLLQGNASWSKDKQLYDGKFTIQKLLKKNICHQAIFYHSTIFKRNKNNFNIKYRVCADYDFNMQVWLKYNPLYLERTIAKFNVEGTSTQTQDLPFDYDFSKNVLTYFQTRLYLSCFQKFRKDIFQQSKKKFRQFKIVQASYFFIIALYFTLRKTYQVIRG